MAEVKRRRFPVWSLAVAGLAIGILLVVGALHLYVRSAETRHWEEMRTWCEQTARELRARDSRRPVLRGDALPGNAWDDYETALRSVESNKVLSTTEVYLNNPAVDPEKVRPVV